MIPYILISATNELYITNISNSPRIVSLIFAILVIIFFIFLLLFTFYLSVSSYKLDENKHNKLGEFFLGIKQQKRFKIYTTIFLFRRGFFVVYLLALQTVKSKIVIGGFSFVQLIYTIYLIFFRPFIEKKGNIIEIINELFFFLLFGSLIFLNKESDWNTNITSAYVWVILANNLVVGVIVIGKFNLITILLYLFLELSNIIIKKIIREVLQKLN